MKEHASAPAGNRPVRFDQRHLRLLKRQQALFVDPSEQTITLVAGALNGGPRSLLSCHLPPASFRVCAVLLLAAPEIVSHPMLYASLYCPDACIEAMLTAGSLLVAEFQALVAQCGKRFHALNEAEFENQLQPVRYAVKRLNQALRQKQFGWKADNKYGQGYVLIEVTLS